MILEVVLKYFRAIFWMCIICSWDIKKFSKRCNNPLFLWYIEIPIFIIYPNTTSGSIFEYL